MATDRPMPELRAVREEASLLEINLLATSDESFGIAQLSRCAVLVKLVLALQLCWFTGWQHIFLSPAILLESAALIQL